jgi:hypothetical protein
VRGLLLNDPGRGFPDSDVGQHLWSVSKPQIRQLAAMGGAPSPRQQATMTVAHSETECESRPPDQRAPDVLPHSMGASRQREYR